MVIMQRSKDLGDERQSAKNTANAPERYLPQGKCIAYTRYPLDFGLKVTGQIVLILFDILPHNLYYVVK